MPATPRTFMFVRPAVADAVVRRPDTGRPLDAAGERVPDGAFWRRRLAQGDVVETPAPRAAKPAKPARKAAPAPAQPAPAQKES